MRATIINAYGRSNRGDSVLLDECIDEIKGVFPGIEISAAVFEGVEVASEMHPYVAWSERIGNASKGKLAKVKTLWYMFCAYVRVRLGFRSIGKMLPPAQLATLDAMLKSEIVISAPGGYIHDTNFAYFVALFHIYLAVLMKKIVVLAPQSVGPIDGKFARFIARRVLTRVPFICPRETYSYNFLIDDIKTSLRQTFKSGDSAFWNENVESDESLVRSEFKRLNVPDDAEILGVTVVGWTFPKSANRKQSYERYVSEMASVVDYASEVLGMVPVIFNQVSEDLPTAHAVAAAAKYPVVVDNNTHEPNILRAMIAKSRVFVGTRFHSCIFAMVASRPTIAVAYLPKTQYIMEDLELSGRVHDIDSEFSEKVKMMLNNDLNSNEEAVLEIRSAVGRYKKNFKRLTDILQLIGARPSGTSA